MRSLRSIPLMLSLSLCGPGLAACAADTPSPSFPERAPAQSSVEASSAAWMEMSADAPEPGGSVDEAVAAHFAALQRADQWSYEGDSGPDRWGKLSSEFVVCGSGSMQSPVDISPGRVSSDPGLELIDFGYASIPLWMMNDGRIVQIANSTPAAINAASRTWRLREIQLHSPSEHTLDGAHADLEIEMLHDDDDGHVAVVSLLFRKGDKNEVLAPVFDALPEKIGRDVELATGSLDLAALIPSSPSYFTYTGSLTTPGCAEDVRWFVLQPVGTVSAAQIERLRAVTVPNSARPTQPLGGRKIVRPL